jgi:hypothetical protein
MLIWHNIILVFWIKRLIMGRDVDLVVWKLVFAEVFEEVSISGSVEVHVGVVGVFGL